MPSYNLLIDQTSATSAPIQFPVLITNPVLVISIENLLLDHENWVRSGWAQAVSTTNIGAVRGRGERVFFGLQEFSFAVPHFPFSLRFIPKPWVKSWHIKVWERQILDPSGPGSTGEFDGVNDLNAIYRKLLDLEAKVDAL
jgi:hypothetical protein